MKYLVIIILAIGLYIVYLSQTNMIFMHLFNMQKVRELAKPVILKELKTIADINGSYELSCKYKDFPYEVGVGFNYEYLPSSFHKTNPKKSNNGQYIIKAKLTLKNNGDIISKITSNNVGGYGSLEYEKYIVLQKFSLKKCDNLTLKIDFIESDIKDIPYNLMYLYYKVDTQI